MKKKKLNRQSSRAQEKKMNQIFIGFLVATVILFVALIVIKKVNEPDVMNYVVTEDGHVHAADGTHIGDYDEVFGSGYTLTEDGHIHAADGTHVGEVNGETAEDTHAE